MNYCNKCIWARRDGGCNSWDCTFIDQTEAANAYTDRLDKRIKGRKTGRWTKDNACEFCGFQPWYEGNIHTLSYCPNCGAKMEGETNG